MSDADIEANFVEDLKNEFARMLRKAGYSIAEGDLTVFEVATRYLNALRRSIPRQPRALRRSAGFACPPELESGLALVEQKAAAGAALVGHQSTKLVVLEFNDALLNDWDIHHFHLGTTAHPKVPGFVARTGPVLFARVTDSTFDLIDVRAHGTWHEQELIQIVHANWPESLAHHRAVGLQAERWSDETVKTFRSKNLSYLLTMPDGVSYFSPGGGAVMSGLSVQVVTAAHRLIASAQEREAQVRAGFSEFCDRAASAGHTINRPARVHLRVRSDGWVAEDAATGFNVDIFRFPTSRQREPTPGSSR